MNRTEGSSGSYNNGVVDRVIDELEKVLAYDLMEIERNVTMRIDFFPVGNVLSPSLFLSEIRHDERKGILAVANGGEEMFENKEVVVVGSRPIRNSSLLLKAKVLPGGYLEIGYFCNDLKKEQVRGEVPVVSYLSEGNEIIPVYYKDLVESPLGKEEEILNSLVGRMTLVTMRMGQINFV